MKLNQPFGSVESEIENLNINFKQKNYSEIIERSKGLIKKFPSIIPFYNFFLKPIIFIAYKKVLCNSKLF